MSANDDRLFPRRNKSRDVFDKNRLPKDSSIQDVTDSAIRTFPHLLKLKLLNSSLIRGYSSTFDPHSYFFDRLSRINCDLIIGSISVLDAEVVVSDRNIDEREDQFFFDDLPNDSSHLVSVYLNYRECYIDFFLNHFMLLCRHYFIQIYSIFLGADIIMILSTRGLVSTTIDGSIDCCDASNEGNF